MQCFSFKRMLLWDNIFSRAQLSCFGLLCQPFFQSLSFSTPKLKQKPKTKFYNSESSSPNFMKFDLHKYSITESSILDLGRISLFFLSFVLCPKWRITRRRRFLFWDDYGIFVPISCFDYSGTQYILCYINYYNSRLHIELCNKGRA